MTSKVSFYCSRLNGNKLCWPVEVIRTGADGWHFVRGLAGRFKGRTFTIVGSEISSYVPKGYKLAPGAKAFLPKLSHEYAQAKKLHAQTYKLLSGAQSSGSIPIATAQQLLKKVEALAFTLQPRTPFDRAWKDYGKDIEEAQSQIERRNGTYAVGQLHSALGMIEGAASREKGPEQHGRDPFFGKKLGSRAKSRLSEGRMKHKFDRLYTGFKNEGSSATTAYRKAIQMMPGYHTPEAQKAWLEDLAEYEKHAHLIDKNDHFHLSLRDPLRGGIFAKRVKSKRNVSSAGRRDPSTSKSYFIIMTRLNDPKYGGQGLPWTTIRWSMVGSLQTGDMRFSTKTAAQGAIQEIRSYGPDWKAAEYKVIGEREITTSSRSERGKR